MARRTGSTIPHYKRRPKRSLLARILLFAVKLVFAFLVISLLWVLAYRFINPPITATMLGDVFAGRGATRDWMSIERIDRDMVRASIAAEDSKFCQHNGFDLDAIENAAKRNASGGRIRGGSTISQQTAKNAFLWQGGGYFRKGLEAWFTLLIEQMWPKRRIMEVYLNIAETGIGTYGVNAGSRRYFGHDASAMSRTEAARIAAVLPLPKARGAIAPKGFTRGYGNTIAARIGVVARDGLDACVYAGTTAPADRAPPATTSRTRPVPGAEYETARPLPPVEEPVVVEPDPAAEQPRNEPAQPAPGYPPPPLSNEGPPPTDAEPEQEPPPPPNAADASIRSSQRTIRNRNDGVSTPLIPQPYSTEESMATRTQNRTSSKSTRTRSRSTAGGSSGNTTTNSNASERSAFSWSDNAPVLIGAAVAGAAIGFAANFGRKFVTQAVSGLTGEWDEVLATEHDMTVAIFDKMLATDSTQTWKRGMLLMQLTHALDKHAHEEEMIVYPALREANETVDADHLTEEHGYIKTFLYELGQMGPEHMGWLDKVREFRTLVVEHAKMEEEQVFPRFKKSLSEEQNAKITSLVNRDGFWQA